MLTARAKAFIFVIGFSLFICWYTQARLAYFVAAFMLSTLLISYLLFRFSLISVDCLRDAPPCAYEDDILDIGVTLENRGVFSESFFNFLDYFHPEIENPEKEVFVEELPRGSAAEFIYKGRCIKRGVYSLGPCLIKKCDFFGFFEKEQKLYPESKLAVFPRTFNVGFFPLGMRSSTPRYGNLVMRRSGDYEEFYGVRDYTKEDGLRKIHWPLSAKHNKLVVRHFEQTSAYIGTVILNLRGVDNIGSGRDTTLEYSIKIAASVSEYLMNGGGMVQMLAYGDTPILSGFGKTRSHYMHLLEILAALESSTRIDFHASLARLEPLIPNGSSLAVCVLDTDKESQATLDSMAAKKDLYIVEIILLSSSFREKKKAEKTRQWSAEPHGIFRYYVGYKDSLADVFREKPRTYEYTQM